MLNRLIPWTIVVKSNDAKGIIATIKDRKINTCIKKSLRLRDAIYDLVGLNLSKSITGLVEDEETSEETETEETETEESEENEVSEET